MKRTKYYILLGLLFLRLPAWAQHESIASMIVDAVAKEGAKLAENDCFGDTLFIMLDLWDIEIDQFLQSDIGLDKHVVWMSSEKPDRSVNRNYYWHVSLSLEYPFLGVYIQTGLGYRSERVGHCYQYPFINDDNSDEHKSELWDQLFHHFLKEEAVRGMFVDTIPIVFGKYKNLHDYQNIGFNKKIGNVEIVPMSQFEKDDNSCYFNFEDDFLGRPFLIVDFSFSKVGNLVVYFRVIILEEGYLLEPNGMYQSKIERCYELTFDKSTPTILPCNI